MRLTAAARIAAAAQQRDRYPQEAAAEAAEETGEAAEAEEPPLSFQ